ncbi:hypothetical protein ACFVHW_04200 [Streptomyces sp. NPDC127110]|uniref:hypothetical protein n=1 Tax=Streptomyces sp. NPDC127110 TaxID=3345362 RepID=UPI003637F642
MDFPVMSPLVSERIWAMPIGGASVKFFNYLVHRGEPDNGALPNQKQMSVEYGVSQASISTLMDPLVKLNLVLRPESESGRKGNSYRLHPLAAKYSSIEAMQAVWKQALHDMQAGVLAAINLPEYKIAPPAEGDLPRLHRVA